MGLLFPDAQVIIGLTDHLWHGVVSSMVGQKSRKFRSCSDSPIEQAERGR